MERRAGHEDLLRTRRIVLLQDRDPADQLVAEERVASRVCLEGEAVSSFLFREYREDEHVTVSQHFQRGIERALAYQRLPCFLPLPCRHPDTPLFNRHPTTCIIILCVLTNNHG